MDGKETRCLLDTEASDNFLSEKLARRLRIYWNVGQGSGLQLANQTCVPTLGVAKVKIRLKFHPERKHLLEFTV